MNVVKKIYKVGFYLRQKKMGVAKKLGVERESYVSHWHPKFNKGVKNTNNFLTAKPNPGAGVGHQIANWNAGYWYAKEFNLQFAHLPFCSSHKRNDVNQWESFLNFGEGEHKLDKILNEGYRIVRLPMFDGELEQDIEYARKIIDSYGKRKVVFLLEQDQFYYRQYDVIDDIQTKFYKIHSKKEAKLYKENYFNIAIHVRRGDIIQNNGDENPNLTMRYQSNSYFLNALSTALNQLNFLEKKYSIFLFSQGKEEEFKDFQKFENLHLCLDMCAKESFLHMVYADALITSKSSFSYKPALLNKGIKFSPIDFWHGYPEDNNWVMLDEFGRAIDGEK